MIQARCPKCGCFAKCVHDGPDDLPVFRCSNCGHKFDYLNRGPLGRDALVRAAEEGEA